MYLVFFDNHISIYNTFNMKNIIYIYIYYRYKHMHIYLYTHTYMYIYHIVCMWKIYPACYLRITWLIEYVGYLYWILIGKNMFKCNAFFVSNLILKSDVNSIWILSFSCSYQKVSMYTTTCTKSLAK